MSCVRAWIFHVSGNRTCKRENYVTNTVTIASNLWQIATKNITMQLTAIHCSISKCIQFMTHSHTYSRGGPLSKTNFHFVETHEFLSSFLPSLVQTLPLLDLSWNISFTYIFRRGYLKILPWTDLKEQCYRKIKHKHSVETQPKQSVQRLLAQDSKVGKSYGHEEARSHIHKITFSLFICPGWSRVTKAVSHPATPSNRLQHVATHFCRHIHPCRDRITNAVHVPTHVFIYIQMYAWIYVRMILYIHIYICTILYSIYISYEYIYILCMYVSM